MFLAGVAAPGYALAPDTTRVPTYTFPPVKTTALRERHAAALPGARTVLDRASLDRLDPTDLSQALLRVAGLRVLQIGDGTSQTVSMRGLSPDRAVILVDGRALNTAQGGGVDLQPLDLEDVERVEVTRGAVGALYGPGALGGAVNLVRTVHRNRGGSARIIAGTDDRALLRLRYGLGRNRWNLDALFRAETFSPELDGRSVRSEGSGGHLNVALHPVWAAALEADVEYRASHRDVPGTRQFPTAEAHRDDRYRELALTARAISASRLPGTLDLNLATSRLERRYRDAGNPFGAVSDVHDNRRERFTASWNTALDTGTLRATVEAVRDRLVSTADGDVRRNRAALALLGSPAWHRWGATVAVRADAVEHFDPRGTVRASVTRTLRGSADAGWWIALRVGGGTSFRPPTFDDLFWPARAGAAGNTDLQPERAHDLDLGLEARNRAAQFQASAFRSEIRDLIQWVPGPDGVWRPHNVSGARIRGIELEGSVAATLLGTSTRLDASLSWLDAIDDTGDRVTGGKQLVGRARYSGFGEASVELGPLTVASGVRGVSRTPLTAANTKWAEGYALVHGSVRWKISSVIRIDVEGQNLFDTSYEDIRGYATTGRQALLGIRYSP